jgi:hypothetical protein
MEAKEYLDPERFPLTTQRGLTLQQQQLLDAANLDDLREWLAQGKALSDAQRRALAELEEKASHWSSLRTAESGVPGDSASKRFAKSVTLRFR